MLLNIKSPFVDFNYRLKLTNKNSKKLSNIWDNAVIKTLDTCGIYSPFPLIQMSKWIKCYFEVKPTLIVEFKSE